LGGEEEGKGRSDSANVPAIKERIEAGGKKKRTTPSALKGMKGA
jgi:hypothetical protein